MPEGCIPLASSTFPYSCSTLFLRLSYILFDCSSLQLTTHQSRPPSTPLVIPSFDKLHNQTMAALEAEVIDDKTTSRGDSTTASETAVDHEKDIPQTAPSDEVKDVAEAPPRQISGWKWYLTFISILASTFLYALDATVVADLQPIIVEDLGGIQDLSWLSVAFLLCATATNLFWGRMYANFNVKWLYIFHVVVFEIGSAICGAAPSINVMILGRAIAGLGGSGLYVGCMTLIAMTTTMTERPLYISCTGFSWGAGIVLGPIIGGAFESSAVGWRWAFYINLFIGAACAPFYIFLIPSKDARPGASLLDRAKENDYLGAFLQGGMLTAIILAINWGGVTFPWNSGRIIALFVVSGVVLIMLGIQQVWTIGTTQGRRLIPVQLIKSPLVLILFCCSAASGACAFVPIYFVPVFFQFTRGDDALEAGVRLLPFVCFMVALVFLNGALMGKLGYYMPWYLGGGILVVIGSALMYTVDQDTSTAKIYGYSILLGVGVGMFLQAAFSVAQAVVDVENIAPCIGFITLAQFVGITLALAIANSILLNQSEAAIQQLLPTVPLSEIQAAILGVNSDLVKSLSPDLQRAVIGAIVTSIDNCYVLVIAGGSLVAVSSIFMPREKLFGASSGIHAA